MKPTCHDPACERPRARQQPDEHGQPQWWCLWHPTQTAPAVDLRSGKLREPEKQTALQPSAQLAKATRKAKPKVTAARPTPPADGLCVKGCGAPFRHRGVCRGMRVGGIASPPFDTAEVARRYAAGGLLFDLAREYRVGVNRVRAALLEHGVPMRPRGGVSGGQRRRPYDQDQARELYSSGLTCIDVARALGVHSSRIGEQMRTEGILRAAGRERRTARRTDLVDLRVRLDPTLAAQLRTLAAGGAVTDLVRTILEQHVQQQLAGAA